jgi:hypothetical protein
MNSTKPRSWIELRKRRERAESGTISTSSSLRLVADTSSSVSTEADTVLIKDFTNFHTLRHVFEQLRSLPTPLYGDWITCCQQYIRDDIIGNTPDENQENEKVFSFFSHFSEIYDALMKDSSIDEDTRSQQIQLALLELLRLLITKTARLGPKILELTLS